MPEKKCVRAPQNLEHFRIRCGLTGNKRYDRGPIGDYGWPIGCLVVLAILGCGGPTTETATVIQVDGPFQATGYDELDRGSLSDELANSEQPLLIEFGVDFGCERCDAMKSVVGTVASRFEGRAKVFRLDYRENADLVAQLNLGICPSYAIFIGGQLVDRCVGVADADFLSGKLMPFVSDPPPSEE